MAYAIKFKGKSLNADRAASLKSFDSSQISVLRVVTNEILHSLEFGDTRGLHAVLVHVSNRASVFSTIRSIVKVATDDTLKVSETEKGVEVKRSKKSAMNKKIMGLIVEARDGEVTGVFNTAFLKSIGIGGKNPTPVFNEVALVKAIDSLVKRVTDAKMDNAHVLKLLTAKLAVEEEQMVPTFGEGGLASVG
jgi:hypothetical protein